MFSFEKPHKIVDKTKAFDPCINEDNPEFISKCRGIFQPEYEDVFYNCNSIYVQKKLSYRATSDDGFHEAKEVWQRSDENSMSLCDIIDELHVNSLISNLSWIMLLILMNSSIVACLCLQVILHDKSIGPN